MDTDIKSYLSIIYGENVKVLFDAYVFTWDTAEKEEKSGYLMAVNGAKLITEKINDVVEIKNRATGSIDGYVVFLHGQLKSLHKVCKDKKYRYNLIKDNVMVISSSLTFEKAKIQSRYYKHDRADMILTFEFKRYTLKYKENGELDCFASHS